MASSGIAAGCAPPLATESGANLKVLNATSPAKAAKDSARYQQIMNERLLKPDAQRILSKQVLCSVFNRQINTRYIIEDLGPRIRDKGFAPDRAHVGMVRLVRGEKAKQSLIAHNAKMRKCAAGHYPPLEVTAEQLVELYECVGGNHLTTAVGCFAIKLEAFNGFVFDPPDDDSNLKLVTNEGHLYFILKPDTPDADMVFLSEYLNAAQNQDQFHSEMHLQSTVRNKAFQLLAEKPYVSTATIIHEVCCDSVVKLRADNVGDLATWVVPFHGSDHLENFEFS